MVVPAVSVALGATGRARTRPSVVITDVLPSTAGALLFCAMQDVSPAPGFEQPRDTSCTAPPRTVSSLNRRNVMRKAVATPSAGTLMASAACPMAGQAHRGAPLTITQVGYTRLAGTWPQGTLNAPSPLESSVAGTR